MPLPRLDDPALLAADLLARLAALPRAAQAAGLHVRGAGVFSYRALERERILAARLAHPALGILLRGRKEVWIGETCCELAPGTVFVLPGAVDFDVVNQPDPRRGIYETLVLEVRARPEKVAPAAPAARFDIRVPLTPGLVESIAHAALSLVGRPHAERLAELRLAELLVQLADVPTARPLFVASLAERIAWIVRSSPDRNWTGEALARLLGIGGSTLRRHLKAEGSTLRTVVRDARLEVARDLIEGALPVAEAAAAAGFVSRSHFARSYRERFGALPSGRPAA